MRLSKFICAFENTYQERHSGRLLTFLPFESYGELFFYPNSTNVARESGSRSATKYTLACSAPQMAILLLLGKQSYVVNELQNILGISLDLFWYFLEPLLEHNIVLKEILRKDVENSIMHEDLSETLLVANTEFYSDNHLIVLTSNSSSKTSALLSKAALSQRDPSHRIFAIQAALIRLLKEHKELAIDSIFDLLTEKMNLYITPEQRDTLPLVYTALEEKGFLIIEKDKLKYLP